MHYHRPAAGKTLRQRRHWIPGLVDIAGGMNLGGIGKQPSRQVAWERIIEYNPEILVVSCRGYSMEQTLREIDLLWANGSSPLRAGESGRIWIVDGSAYFSRPGPRIVDSLEQHPVLS